MSKTVICDCASCGKTIKLKDGHNVIGMVLCKKCWDAVCTHTKEKETIYEQDPVMGIAGGKLIRCKDCNKILFDGERWLADDKKSGWCLDCFAKIYNDVFKPDKPKEGGKKFDQGKNDWSIIPFECLDELAKIMTYGVAKYGKPSGWASVPDMKNRYFSALMRHLSAYKQGERVDKESNHRHISHALCNVVFLLWKELQEEKERADEEDRISSLCQQSIYERMKD